MVEEMGLEPTTPCLQSLGERSAIVRVGSNLPAFVSAMAVWFRGRSPGIATFGYTCGYTRSPVEVT